MATRKTPAAAPKEAAPAATQTVSSRSRAFVFISHDSRDADLAEAFANLLSDVSAGTLKSFRSSDKKGSSGIEFGTEWYSAIMSQLGDATDVVALLTKHSTDRPWILYEAGVAKGKLDTNVLGIALGVPLDKVSTGPFAQFQNCSDDEDSLTKLVIQLLKRNPDASPREEAVRMQVRIFLDNAKKFIEAKGKPTATETDESNIAKLFEEVKVMVRQLPERVDDRVRSVAKRGGMKRMRRFHPMMLEELLFHPTLRKGRGGQAAAWLLFLSVFRDDLPWVYDLGIGVYEALREGDTQALKEAADDFRNIVQAATEGPFFHEMVRPDDEDAYYVVRHLPQMVDRFLGSVLEQRPSARLRRSPTRDLLEPAEPKDA